MMENVSRKSWIRLAAHAVSIASLVTIVSTLPLYKLSSQLTETIENVGPWGPIVTGISYVVATILFVPGTLLTLVAGAVFGIVRGFAVVSIASTLGAACSFLIARYVARDRVANMAESNRHFDAIDAAIEEGGWKVVGLLRLSPAIPFNLQNYLYGLTGIRFWPYVVTSWIAMMPGTLMYVYLGHVSGAALSGDRERSMAEWGLLAVGLVSTVAVTGYVTQLAKKKLNEVEEEVVEPGTELTEHGGQNCRKSDASEGWPILPIIIAASLTTAAIAVFVSRDRIERSFQSDVGKTANLISLKAVGHPLGVLSSVLDESLLPSPINTGALDSSHDSSRQIGQRNDAKRKQKCESI